MEAKVVNVVEDTIVVETPDQEVAEVEVATASESEADKKKDKKKKPTQPDPVVGPSGFSLR